MIWFKICENIQYICQSIYLHREPFPVTKIFIRAQGHTINSKFIKILNVIIKYSVSVS